MGCRYCTTSQYETNDDIEGIKWKVFLLCALSTSSFEQKKKAENKGGLPVHAETLERIYLPSSRRKLTKYRRALRTELLAVVSDNHIPPRYANIGSKGLSLANVPLLLTTTLKAPMELRTAPPSSNAN